MADPIYRDRVTYRTGGPVTTDPAPTEYFQVNAQASVPDYFQVNAPGSPTPDYFQVSAP